MQYRLPAGLGPSLKTWPRWPPQRRHTTSVRIMPWEVSSFSRTFSAANAMTLLVYAALGAVLFFLVLQLQTVSGYGALEAGRRLTVDFVVDGNIRFGLDAVKGVGYQAVGTRGRRLKEGATEMKMPTSTSGPTPSRRRWCASWFAAASSSP